MSSVHNTGVLSLPTVTLNPGCQQVSIYMLQAQIARTVFQFFRIVSGICPNVAQLNCKWGGLFDTGYLPCSLTPVLHRPESAIAFRQKAQWVLSELSRSPSPENTLYVSLPVPKCRCAPGRS